MGELLYPQSDRYFTVGFNSVQGANTISWTNDSGRDTLFPNVEVVDGGIQTK
jgi:hypothetical protein